MRALPISPQPPKSIVHIASQVVCHPCRGTYGCPGQQVPTAANEPDLRLYPLNQNVTKRVEVPVLISAWRGVCTQIQPECVISLQIIFPVLPPQLHLQQVCTKSASGECGF